MSIKDVLKSSFLESFDVSSINYASILVSLAIALAMGILISMIYTKFFGGVVYSRGYAQTLIGMSVLTCMVTLAISTNVVISLGMVGSLSIIRYRTAIKSPLDLLYMFWAVTVGITTGAQMYALALIASCAMFIVVLIFRIRPQRGRLYVAVFHYEGIEAEEQVIRALGRGRYHIKSKTIYGDRTELAVELFCGQKKLNYFESMRNIPGVSDITFVQYDGEYHG